MSKLSIVLPTIECVDKILHKIRRLIAHVYVDYEKDNADNDIKNNSWEVIETFFDSFICCFKTCNRIRMFGNWKFSKGYNQNKFLSHVAIMFETKVISQSFALNVG